MVAAGLATPCRGWKETCHPLFVVGVQHPAPAPAAAHFCCWEDDMTTAFTMQKNAAECRCTLHAACSSFVLFNSRRRWRVVAFANSKVAVAEDLRLLVYLARLLLLCFALLSLPHGHATQRSRASRAAPAGVLPAPASHGMGPIPRTETTTNTEVSV